MSPRTITMFVYGTLRQGGDLHHLIRKSIVWSYGKAWTPGALHYVSPNYEGFPVFDPDGDGYVVGEVFELMDNADTRYTICMELAAGYNAEWITMDTEEGDTVSALTFTYRRPDRGRRIETGDFMDPNTKEEAHS